LFDNPDVAKRYFHMPSVRITAYPVHWLTESEGFATKKVIIWSTAEKTEPDDIQVFAISATLRDRRDWAEDARMDLADDPRRDAVNSIWKALTTPLPGYENDTWPIQARFKLLVRLECPVPKADLIQAGLLKERWPQHFRGKLVRTQAEIQALAKVLSLRNPKQRPEIFSALGIHPTVGNSIQGTTPTAKKGAGGSGNDEIADEEVFLEGEKRAVNGTARNPKLRAAAKKRWGLKCCCCGFDFEQFYGILGKGLAIVHHLQVFEAANGKPRSATVEDVRVVFANCHYVIHVKKQPIHVDDLKDKLSNSWTPWTENGIARTE
jgi:hypothetical protein